jgi:hypothetical protein
MILGCSWREKVNTSDLVLKYGVILESSGGAYTVVSLSDNGRIVTFEQNVDTQLKGELISTVSSKVSATMQALLTEIVSNND